VADDEKWAEWDRKPKSKKKTTKQIKKDLTAECLRLWSLCIRTRDRKCQLEFMDDKGRIRSCSEDTYLQAHHLLGKRNHSAIMFDLDNGLTICRNQHFLEKANPAVFHNMIIRTEGIDKLDELRRREINLKYGHNKFTIDDLLRIKAYLTAKLKQLQSDYGVL